MTPTLAAAAVTLSRSIELSIIVKATVILMLGIAAAHMTHRAQASLRHLLLAVTFAAAIALPVFVVAVPAVAISVPVARSPQVAASNATPPRDMSVETPGANVEGPLAPNGSTRWTPSWPVVFRAVWAAGTLALLVPLAAALWRLRRIRRTALPRTDLRRVASALACEAGIRRAVDVLEHESVPAPITCGVWHPAIVLPPDSRGWTDADVRRALVHELEHVRRGDWLIQIAVRAACAAYWLHPLVWTASRRLCLEAERACDDAVARGSDRTDYADQLVLLARRMSNLNPAALLGMANRSDLSARVAALLDDTQRRGRAGVVPTLAAVLSAIVIAAAIAPVRAVAFTPSAATLRLRSGQAANSEQSTRSSRRSDVRVRGIDRALYEAAENGDVAEVDGLLRAGANINSALDGDGSPLIAAARTNRLAVVRHLLDRGADPNMPVPGDGSPLIVAADEGAVAIVALLLDRGALVDQVVPGDENALIAASGNGRLDVVTLLVARGADVNVRVWAPQGPAPQDGEWRTPLSMARRGRNPAVVEFLLSAGARE